MAKKTGRKAPQRSAQQTGAPSRPNWLFRGGLIAIVIVGAGWLLLGGGQGGSGPPPTHPELLEVLADAEADPSVGVLLGPESAPITIEEFYDPSCPHCATFAGFAGKLIRQNYVETANAPVRWISYDYLVGFPNSVAASLAARCAGEQGLYWPVHDLLLARQTRWYQLPDPGDAIAEIAGAAGVDSGAWGECMRERRHLGAIAASHKVGESRGVSSTPSLFIDGVRVDLAGVDPYMHIESLIQARLAAMDESREEMP
ncbi:DsbA family protein [Candidatus Palauibacter sp.]|uniref:DsbA family protein n=1 Tax=Candidatus Palauibacter sp. TaxID=3101350 RepID=UPI003B021A52